jgi:hypothetical protein
VYNPYNIKGTHHASLDYSYQLYSMLEPTHRAVPGIGLSCPPQRPPFGMQAADVGLAGYGMRIFCSKRNEIEEAKYIEK